MRLQILSDLHLEFGDFDLPATDADVLVLAGDIHTKLHGIHWIKERAPKDIPIIYIAGNHEFYGERHPRLLDKIKSTARGSNVHVLENEGVSIDGYHFFGCTLWTDMALHGDAMLGSLASMAMNDYSRIRDSYRYRKLSPSYTATEHKQSVAAIERFLARNDPQKTIVVTHHAPSIHSLPDHRRYEPISAAYASNLESIISAHAPTLWIHGHIHTSQDYPIGRTRILSNPRGYIDEPNPDFAPTRIWNV